MDHCGAVLGCHGVIWGATGQHGGGYVVPWAHSPPEADEVDVGEAAPCPLQPPQDLRCLLSGGKKKHTPKNPLGTHISAQIPTNPPSTP